MNVAAFMSEYPMSPRSGTSQSQVHGKKVIVNNKEIALFYYKDVFYAVDEQCPHLGMCLMLCHVNYWIGYSFVGTTACGYIRSWCIVCVCCMRAVPMGYVL